MPFDALRFIFGRTLIQNQGVPGDEATRLAIVPGILEGSLAQSLVISTVIGRSNAPAATAVSPPAATAVSPPAATEVSPPAATEVSPPAATEVSPPATVVEVPDVNGLTFAIADGKLKDMGLAAARVVIAHRREDTVVHQAPEAGAFVALNSTVQLFVGEPAPPGAVLVVIPEIRGDSFEKATGRLEMLGLKTARQEAISEKHDVVVDQEPKAGQQVEPGTTVTIFVGKTPESRAGEQQRTEQRSKTTAR